MKNNKSKDAVKNGKLSDADARAIVKRLFQVVKPTSSPSSINDALSKAAKSCGITNLAVNPPSLPKSGLEMALTYILNGFTSSDITTITNGGVCFPFQKLRSYPLIFLARYLPIPSPITHLFYLTNDFIIEYQVTLPSPPLRINSAPPFLSLHLSVIGESSPLPCHLGQETQASLTLVQILASSLHKLALLI